MSNRLASENSPYLLQHAENPVDWYPWGKEALEKAKTEDKPIFLSIGYSACHWCHVMAHESFEDPGIAQIMNDRFVNIKVDREERPDLDNIYMNAVVAMTGQGGWPMSVFLTPDGRPLYGGTYFPPARRYNLPSFKEVLQGVSRAWQENREDLLGTGEKLAERLQEMAMLNLPHQTLNPEYRVQAVTRLSKDYDWKHGGWGMAPKFPQPMTIEFLLRRAAAGDQTALDMSLHALRAMAKGGMYDVVGGGFARYSTDDQWLVPHFEKMLYDNAQLARVYLYAFLLTDDESFRRVCEETLDFLVREMMYHPVPGSPPQGGFFSSLDADSDGEEGKFYVWTSKEIQHVFDDPLDVEWLISAYQVSEAGNFEGANILQRQKSDTELAEEFQVPIESVPERLVSLHRKLYQAREKRVRPGFDDKVLVSWNAFALRAFAEAGRYLKRTDYLDIARQNADFLLTELNPKDRLLRSWREGKAQHNAYLEDYASLALGLLALYQSDPDPYWYRSSIQLIDQILAHFRDSAGGFFDTRDDHETLLARPKEIQDNATPSGSSLAALALLQVSAFSGRSKYREVAEAVLGSFQEIISQYPTAFGNWLCAFDFSLNSVQEIAILGDLDLPSTQTLIDTVWSVYQPNLILAASPYPPSENAPALLFNRPLRNDEPTAYVCHGFVCQAPVNDAAELQRQLSLT